MSCSTMPDTRNKTFWCIVLWNYKTFPLTFQPTIIILQDLEILIRNQISVLLYSCDEASSSEAHRGTLQSLGWTGNRTFCYNISVTVRDPQK